MFTKRRTPSVDSVLSAQKTIDEPHGKIHEGLTFTISMLETPSGSSSSLILCSPTKNAHVIFDFALQATGIVFLVRTPVQVGINKRITLTPVNLDGTSSNLSDVLVYQHSAIDATSGATVSKSYLPTASGPRNAGAEGDGRQEYILASGDSVALRYTGAATTVNIRASWYEVS